MLALIVAIMLLSLLPYARAQDSLQSENLKPYEVTYGGSTFEVRAAMPGDGKVDGIEVYPEYGSILLTLEVGSQSNGGEFTIILPRALIDAKDKGLDSKFLVVVDGENVDYNETLPTQTERMLKFPLPADAFEVEIFGSQVVPELPVGLIAIFGSVISAVLIYHRFRHVIFSV